MWITLTLISIHAVVSNELTSWCLSASQNADRGCLGPALLALIKCSMYCIITVEEIFVLAITVFDSNNHAEDKTKGRVIILFTSLTPE